ncbi:hypothetical protein CEUSTIGMA_g1098.t1 [Chlamydomonas eustigma]|uniref:Uncharacterized protein n=1 Tax=Chlamydomonas eustigma TaxID=1157962 RepID=A0A250WS16_9CHLO|nr:hypothetical protein CEUSTIGMA_g1098.t1 [Chlamydomonas eustigma]|eukprot:GAX73647.1 hypothetical protein CEUSTIGMA_g1098.t1 [Chlamydomonas eustigma]
MPSSQFNINYECSNITTVQVQKQLVLGFPDVHSSEDGEDVPNCEPSADISTAAQPRLNLQDAACNNPEYLKQGMVIMRHEPNLLQKLDGLDFNHQPNYDLPLPMPLVPCSSFTSSDESFFWLSPPSLYIQATTPCPKREEIMLQNTVNNNLNVNIFNTSHSSDDRIRCSADVVESALHNVLDKQLTSRLHPLKIESTARKKKRNSYGLPASHTSSSPLRKSSESITPLLPMAEVPSPQRWLQRDGKWLLEPDNQTTTTTPFSPPSSPSEIDSPPHSSKSTTFKYSLTMHASYASKHLRGEEDSTLSPANLGAVLCETKGNLVSTRVSNEFDLEENCLLEASQIEHVQGSYSKDHDPQLNMKAQEQAMNSLLRSDEVAEEVAEEVITYLLEPCTHEDRATQTDIMVDNADRTEASAPSNTTPCGLLGTREAAEGHTPVEAAKVQLIIYIQTNADYRLQGWLGRKDHDVPNYEAVVITKTTSRADSVPCCLPLHRASCRAAEDEKLVALGQEVGWQKSLLKQEQDLRSQQAQLLQEKEVVSNLLKQLEEDKEALRRGEEALASGLEQLKRQQQDLELLKQQQQDLEQLKQQQQQDLELLKQQQQQQDLVAANKRESFMLLQPGAIRQGTKQQQQQDLELLKQQQQNVVSFSTGEQVPQKPVPEPEIQEAQQVKEGAASWGSWRLKARRQLSSTSAKFKDRALSKSVDVFRDIDFSHSDEEMDSSDCGDLGLRIHAAGAEEDGYSAGRATLSAPLPPSNRLHHHLGPKTIRANTFQEQVLSARSQMVRSPELQRQKQDHRLLPFNTVHAATSSPSYVAASASHFHAQLLASAPVLPASGWFKSSLGSEPVAAALDTPANSSTANECQAAVSHLPSSCSTDDVRHLLNNYHLARGLITPSQFSEHAGKRSQGPSRRTTGAASSECLSKSLPTIMYHGSNLLLNQEACIDRSAEGDDVMASPSSSYSSSSWNDSQPKAFNSYSSPHPSKTISSKLSRNLLHSQGTLPSRAGVNLLHSQETFSSRTGMNTYSTPHHYFSTPKSLTEGCIENIPVHSTPSPAPHPSQPAILSTSPIVMLHTSAKAQLLQLPSATEAVMDEGSGSRRRRAWYGESASSSASSPTRSAALKPLDEALGVSPMSISPLAASTRVYSSKHAGGSSATARLRSSDAGRERSLDPAVLLDGAWFGMPGRGQC